MQRVLQQYNTVNKTKKLLYEMDTMSNTVTIQCWYSLVPRFRNLLRKAETQWLVKMFHLLSLFLVARLIMLLSLTHGIRTSSACAWFFFLSELVIGWGQSYPHGNQSREKIGTPSLHSWSGRQRCCHAPVGTPASHHAMKTLLLGFTKKWL